MQEEGSLRKNITNNPLKIILMWNEWTLKMDDDPLAKARCPITSCLFTTDMSLIQQSDVVVLHFDTLEDFPVNRQPHQRFVFYHFESPINTASELMNDPRFRFNYFNWTMTYRRDSDIFLRDYYGSLVSKRSFVDNIQETRYTYEKNVSDHGVGISHGFPTNFATFEISLSDFIRGKTKMVTWLVSNCFTPIRREEYVRQLSQYVAVDIFGHCANECPSNCDEMIRTDYKFYLALENSWCPDYITEKFSRPFLYEAIPVVLGGADYRQFAPPNSYINVRDFSSPKHLADYLLMLDKNHSLYARYFEWRLDYYISVPDMYGWCELCRMAHDGNLPPKVYRDIKKWWMVDGGECESNSTKFF